MSNSIVMYIASARMDIKWAHKLLNDILLLSDGIQTQQMKTREQQQQQQQQHLQMQQLQLMQQRNAQMQRGGPNHPPLGGPVNGV